MEITDQLLETIKKLGNKIAQHFHIPLQSGCDETLKRMNRKYVMQDYFNVIGKIRYMFPKASITTDCLAGFVGETEDEFNTTYENIKKIGFFECHIFPYSKRPNTKAYDMPNHLHPSVIKMRANKLIELSNELKNEYLDLSIGEIKEVLFEQNKNGYWYGHTSDYIDVYIKSNKCLENEVRYVKLLKNVNGTVYGEEVQNEI